MPASGSPRPLRILVDAREVRAELNGLGRYTTNLLEGLARTDRTNQYVVLARPGLLRQLEAAPNFRVRTSKLGIGDPREHVVLPWLMRRERADVFHSPSMVAPLVRVPGCKTVMTIHDTIPLACPEGFKWHTAALWALMYTFLIRPNAWMSSHVITVSENSRRDVAKNLVLPLEKVSVISNWLRPGYPPELAPAARAEVRLRYGLDGPYVLYVGSEQPYKNVRRLIRAFAAARPELPEGATLALGLRPEADPELPRLVERLAVGDAVRFLGYLPEADLPLLYAEAAVFAYPSLYEGFGLPPLEAMACGAPVLVGDNSSLPEVVGDAGVRVDPKDVGAIARGLVRVLNDPELARTMAALGKVQARRFTAERAVRQTLALYATLARQQAPRFDTRPLEA